MSMCCKTITQKNACKTMRNGTTVRKLFATKKPKPQKSVAPIFQTSKQTCLPTTAKTCSCCATTLSSVKSNVSAVLFPLSPVVCVLSVVLRKTKSVAPVWEQRRCFLNFEKAFARTFAQQINDLSNVLCNEFRQVFLGATCSDNKVYVVFVAYFFQTVVQNAQFCHVAVQQAG